MGTIREVFVLEDAFSAPMTEYIRLARQASSATMAAKGVTRQLGTAQEAVASSASSAAAATQKFTSAQRTAQSSAQSLGEALKKIVSMYAVIQGVKWVGSMSDQLASTTARLDMMNDGLQTTAELQQMIYDSAQRSRGLYTDTAAFVAKLGNLAGNAFSSNSELVAFAEQINKQIALSGATATEVSAAMLQLTQGLSSGALRGEELNSVLEQTPMIAKTIADYMGVTTGEMRNLASEGKVTAEVVKNAMLSAADETNAKFEEMPMTWAQRFNQFKNVAVQALQPLFDAVNKLANSDFMEGAINGAAVALRGLGTAVDWFVDNINELAPVLATATAALAAYKVAVWMVNIAMYANPVGLVVALIVTLVGVLIWAWDTFKGFRDFWVEAVSIQAQKFLWFHNQIVVPVVNSLIPILNQTGKAFQDLATIIVEAFSAAGKFFVQNMDFMLGGLRASLTLYNKIAAASGRKTIDVDYALSVEGIEEARQNALKAISGWGVDGGLKELTPYNPDKFMQNLNNWKDYASNFTLSGFLAEQLGAVSETANNFINGLADPYSDLIEQLSGISSDVSSIKKSVSMSDEDLKSLVNMAERRYVNNVNLMAQTPVINVTGANTGNTAADRKAIADAIQVVLMEQLSSTSVRATAVPT